MLIFAPAAALAQAATGVGFARVTIPDPVNGGTMPGYVFYPSAQAKGYTWQGPYKLKATEDAPPIPGAKPLVVISHGHGGSDLGHHDLATHLASHGFVVATLTHPKDNYLDSSGNGHVDVEIGRPIQVSATITYVLRSPRWRALIDPDRIGVTGFSAGGYTVLMLVGAVPRFARLTGYCKAHPGDKAICGVVKQLKAEAAKHGRSIEQAIRTYLIIPHGCDRGDFGSGRDAPSVVYSLYTSEVQQGPGPKSPGPRRGYGPNARRRCCAAWP